MDHPPPTGIVRHLKLEGDFDLSDGERLSNLLGSLAPDGPAVIDLTDVTYVDSTFLHALADVAVRLGRHRITLVGVSASIRRILATAEFEKLVRIVPSESLPE